VRPQEQYTPSLALQSPGWSGFRELSPLLRLYRVVDETLNFSAMVERSAPTLSWEPERPVLNWDEDATTAWVASFAMNVGTAKSTDEVGDATRGVEDIRLPTTAAERSMEFIESG
jgi:hypothetical protein